MTPQQRIFFHRAGEEAVSGIRSLSEIIWREYYPGIITREQVEYMLERMYGEENLRAEIRSGHVYELARVRDRDAGYLSYSFEKADHRVKLAKLYLLAEFRGRGLGRAMLERVREAARDLAAVEVYLYVNKRNALAIAAYRKFGFHGAESAVADIGGGFVMDDWVMRLSLPARA